MKEQQRQFDANLESLEPIGGFISECMEESGLSEDQIYNFQVSADEHVTNLVEHAFPDSSGQMLTVICRDDDTQAQVCIADSSAGFDPRQYTVPDIEGVPIYEMAPGGFGNYFICELMDKVDYIQNPHVRNELILTVYKSHQPETL